MFGDSEYLGKFGNDFLVMEVKLLVFVFVEGVIIVGVGLFGFVVVVCLKIKGVLLLIIEKFDGIGFLWKYKVYDWLCFYIFK